MQDLSVKMSGVIDAYARQNGYDFVRLYDQKHPVAIPAAPSGKK
ncbi:MAG: hypothetical protein NTW28_00690 [Candidatus Solibacter sp.]|nr:hypothetical protein [Candidatus Solibacter sp.]